MNLNQVQEGHVFSIKDHSILVPCRILEEFPICDSLGADFRIQKNPEIMSPD